MNGLEVSFQAKPIPGVAGSGEHTHVVLPQNSKMVKWSICLRPAI